MITRRLLTATVGLLLAANLANAQRPTEYTLVAPPAPVPAGDGHFWWKGNLHTHTLWSDGDHFPEVVADWYHSNGYHFLQLSDHNQLSRGDRWINAVHNCFIPGAQQDEGYDVVESYRERFGDEWIETRTNDDGELEVRLKTLQEVRTLFEQPGRFLMIEGEEITDGMSVHVIATNILEFIPPQGGGVRQAPDDSTRIPAVPLYATEGDTPHSRIVNNVAAVYEQRSATGQPMIPHLAHPNWYQHLTAEDMFQVADLQFFEVYNGHRGVRNFGESGIHIKHLDRVWDIMLTKRLAELDLGVLYGLAIDDAHHYEGSAQTTAEPGRGWVMVRSRFLTPEHLIAALERGDFYGTNGVILRDITSDDTQLTVEVESEEGVDYTIEFIGTRRGYDPSSEPILDADGNEIRATRVYSRDIGQVLQSSEGTKATYTFAGDEIYVRAKVTSSKDKVNSFAPGEKEMAWVQPVVLQL